MFPTIWSKIDDLATQRIVVSCHEVFEEIKHQDDSLLEWSKRRRGMFENPTEDMLHEMGQLMEQYPNFAASTGGTVNAADPWVIVHARASNAIVVTDEHRVERQKPTKPPKIPNICDELDVLWMSPIDFLFAIGINI